MSGMDSEHLLVRCYSCCSCCWCFDGTMSTALSTCALQPIPQILYATSGHQTTHSQLNGFRPIRGMRCMYVLVGAILAITSMACTVRYLEEPEHSMPQHLECPHARKISPSIKPPWKAPPKTGVRALFPCSSRLPRHIGMATNPVARLTGRGRMKLAWQRGMRLYNGGT